MIYYKYIKYYKKCISFRKKKKVFRKAFICIKKLKEKECILVWFGDVFIGPLLVNINGVKYSELLEEYLIPFYNEDYLFQDDNTPCHTANIVIKKWKEENLMIGQHKVQILIRSKIYGLN